MDSFALRDPIVPFVLARLGDWDFLVIHGHQHDEAGLEDLGRRYRADVVVRGHTHLPGIQRHDPLLLVNPGSISIPMGGNPLRRGIFEDGTVRILELDSGRELASEALRART